jgi:hypothetical protein
LGLNQSSVALDFDGNARPGNAGPDLGAYQGGN